jgi:hypothetical protein
MQVVPRILFFSISIRAMNRMEKERNFKDIVFNVAVNKSEKHTKINV